MEEISSTVKAYVLREFMPGRGADALTDDTPLISSGILDSIATMQLVTFLEESFDITVKAHEIDQAYLNTLASIQKFVESKRV